MTLRKINVNDWMKSLSIEAMRVANYELYKSDSIWFKNNWSVKEINLMINQITVIIIDSDIIILIFQSSEVNMIELEI